MWQSHQIIILFYFFSHREMVNSAGFKLNYITEAPCSVGEWNLNYIHTEIPYIWIIEIHTQNSDCKHSLIFVVECECCRSWLERTFLCCWPEDLSFVGCRDCITGEHDGEDYYDQDGYDTSWYFFVVLILVVSKKLSYWEEIINFETLGQACFAPHFGCNKELKYYQLKKISIWNISEE